MGVNVDIQVERLYELAKAGKWESVLTEFASDLRLAKLCSRYVRKSSGWTFLHQAAYFGADDATRALVGLGAPPGAPANDGEVPSAVARRRGHAALASSVESLAARSGGPWAPPSDADIVPSSSLWAEAEPRRALLPMRVGYAGAVIVVPAGSRYYVDSFERVLVGWHGTFDPPCGMDRNSIIRERV